MTGGAGQCLADLPRRVTSCARAGVGSYAAGRCLRACQPDPCTDRRRMLADHELDPDDIDHVICHQPNLRILDAVQESNWASPAQVRGDRVDRLSNMASGPDPGHRWRRSAGHPAGTAGAGPDHGSGATRGRGAVPQTRGGEPAMLRLSAPGQLDDLTCACWGRPGAGVPAASGEASWALAGRGISRDAELFGGPAANAGHRPRCTTG